MNASPSLASAQPSRIVPIPSTVPVTMREQFAQWLAIATDWVTPRLDAKGEFTEKWPFTGFVHLVDSLRSPGLTRSPVEALPSVQWAGDTCNATDGVESRAAWLVPAGRSLIHA